MKKLFLIFIVVLGATNLFSQNYKTLVSSTDNETVIKFTLEDFVFKTVQTPKGAAQTISAAETTPMLLKGAPDLAKMTAPIIIPDKGTSKIEVVSENYTEYKNILLAPSKGSFGRNIDPATVPYEYGKYYETNEFFPGKLAKVNTPYIMRDLRGQAVQVFPFQYNPVTKTLRVYSEITVKVTNTNQKGENEFNRTRGFDKVSTEFNKIYKSHFLNYQQSVAKYTPLEEEGSMLVICHDEFLDDMTEFVNWKNTIGRPTTMVAASEVGTTSDDIKAYLESYYNDNGLTYLLFVGDATQITPIRSGLAGDSDNGYAYVTGNDSYMEFFVGRFSAETPEQVQTQVERTITYENGSELAEGWLNRAMGVASALGAGGGDDGEADYVHYRNMQADLLGYTYVESLEMFDGNQGGSDVAGDPTPAMIGQAIDNGVGLMTYTGHGNASSWMTSGYSNNDINQLTNDNKLPFIFSVACLNGDFVGKTCFGETWLRATHNDNPTGAIAIYGSTINQHWAPPMSAQDEMIDILVESYDNNIKRTFAGVGVNGMNLMNDEYGTQGYEMTDTWTCFGDPSLLIRTDNPAEFAEISHAPQIIMGAISFTVNCGGADGALVTLSKDGEIVGSVKVENGAAEIPISEVQAGDELKLAVVGFNKVTYLADLIVIAPSGPYISLMSATVNDSKYVNFNSNSNNLKLLLQNFGPEEATNLVVNVTTDDEYVILSNNENIALGNLAGENATLENSSIYIAVANNVPDQHTVNFEFTAQDDSKTVWSNEFSLTVNAPVLTGKYQNMSETEGVISFSSTPVTEVNGNHKYRYAVQVVGSGGNNLLDPGETANLIFTTENIGHAAIYNSKGHLTTDDQYVTINTEETFIEELPVGGSFNSVFNITVSPEAPTPHSIDFEFIFGDDIYDDTISSSVPIGLIFDDFETGDFSKFDWELAGDGSEDWSVVQTNPQEGEYCACSNSPGNSKSAILKITLPGVKNGQKMSFWYKTSTESSYDKFVFSVNGTVAKFESGIKDWAQYEHTFTEDGDYTIKFIYQKDNVMSAGEDKVWLDKVIFPVVPVASEKRSVTITAETLPDWLQLEDLGNGNATLFGQAPNVNESFDVVLKAEGENTVTQEFAVVVTESIAIETINNNISFYPNPTKDLLNINFDNNFENANYEIIDISGKSYMKDELKGLNNQVDLRNVPAGIYIIKLNINGELYQNKLIKQ